MEKPIVPRPMCVEKGGTRLEWDEYHQAVALYYNGLELTLEDIYRIVPADRKLGRG